MRQSRSKFASAAAALLAGGLMLTACGSDDDGGDTTSGDGGDGGSETEVEMVADVDTGSCEPLSGAGEMPDPEGTGDDETEITIGVFAGWDENYVILELLTTVLEEQGYTVTPQELPEAGAVFTGVADGDIDVIVDAWFPNTHATYIDQFGEDLEAINCWFDEGFLTTAVNSDSPAQSLAELADYSEEYGNRIVGIEPGAGLTKTTQEQVIPTYGLEDWDYPTSSSPAMLAELESAMNSGENIAVSLWHPHWAYAAYDIRDLEDPEGALGEAERLYNVGRPGFHEDFPNVAQLLNNLYLSNEQLLEIEDIMVVQNNREKNAESVATWLEDNPDFIDDWRAGELSAS